MEMGELEVYRAAFTPAEAAIVKELEAIQVVDCHEHLPPEAERVAGEVDALTLFSHYCRGDLGALVRDKTVVDFIYDSRQPFGPRWAAFKPFYESMKFTSYARAAHITMQKFYGFSELSDENCDQINAAMKAANKPGLYAKVLREACNIKTCLTQNGKTEFTDDGLLSHVLWCPGGSGGLSWDAVRADFGGSAGAAALELDDLVQGAKAHVDYAKKSGAVGMKFFVFNFKGANRAAAEETLDYLKAHPAESVPPTNALQDYLMSAIFTHLGECGLVCCLHTGYWGDYRTLNPSFALPIVQSHPNTNFDIYHVGYPYVREAIMLGKANHNVWLNMCWTYIISQKFGFDALDEILEMVPVSKILGFGGDYFVIEKVYGHLIMARETIAKVLAKKISEGYMTYDQAIMIAQMMLRTNAEKLYGV